MLSNDFLNKLFYTFVTIMLVTTFIYGYLFLSDSTRTNQKLSESEFAEKTYSIDLSDAKRNADFSHITKFDTGVYIRTDSSKIYVEDIDGNLSSYVLGYPVTFVCTEESINLTKRNYDTNNFVTLGLFNNLNFTKRLNQDDKILLDKDDNSQIKTIIKRGCGKNSE